MKLGRLLGWFVLARIGVRPGLRHLLLVWGALIAASAGAAALLQAARVPAPWLIGPLLVAIAASASGSVSVRVPAGIFLAAQAVIGTLIAQTFTPSVVASIGRSWTIIALVVATTIVAAACSGWILARWSSIPATTAAWGSLPGGASAMTALSADNGADARIVAFMQYLRVTVVVLTAAAVSRALLPHAVHPPLLAAPFDAPALLQTALVAACGAALALRLRLPGAAVLGPMLVGALLHGTGIVRIAVPALVLDAAYVAVGLSIGLLFTRATVRYALRVLPQLLGATVVLVALCCASAALLGRTAHVDALTAYLATTPGGLDSVTAMAVGSGADVPLVLAVQALRLVVVVLIGPGLARLIAAAAEKGAR